MVAFLWRDFFAVVRAANDVVADRHWAVVLAEPAQRAAQVDVEVGDVNSGEMAGEGGFTGTRGALKENAKVRFFRVVIYELHVVLVFFLVAMLWLLLG